MHDPVDSDRYPQQKNPVFRQDLIHVFAPALKSLPRFGKDRATVADYACNPVFGKWLGEPANPPHPQAELPGRCRTFNND